MSTGTAALYRTLLGTARSVTDPRIREFHKLRQQASGYSTLASPCRRLLTRARNPWFAALWTLKRQAEKVLNRGEPTRADLAIYLADLPASHLFPQPAVLIEHPNWGVLGLLSPFRQFAHLVGNVLGLARS